MSYQETTNEGIVGKVDASVTLDTAGGVEVATNEQPIHHSEDGAADESNDIPHEEDDEEHDPTGEGSPRRIGKDRGRGSSSAVKGGGGGVKKPTSGPKKRTGEEAADGIADETTNAESTTAKQSQLQEEPDLITFDTEEHEKKETHQSDQHSGEAQPQPKRGGKVRGRANDSSSKGGGKPSGPKGGPKGKEDEIAPP